MSKNQVSRLCEETDERVKAFLDRPIEGNWPYVWIAVTYVKVRQSGPGADTGSGESGGGRGISKHGYDPSRTLQPALGRVGMSEVSRQPRLKGVFPVVPTTFNEDGELDLESQRRSLDFMIDAGSNGLCILANFSEQFVLTDHEREVLTDLVLTHVAGRVPVIVTTSHFSTRECAERSRRAQAAGAAMVMVMPPYHGATIRAPEAAIYEFFSRVSEAIDIPIMIQDAPVSGTPLSAAFLVRMAQEIPNVCYFKIEVAQAATKLRQMIELGGMAIEGPWDGEEGITLLPDLDAGATGSMTGGGYPDGIRQIFDPYHAGRRDEALAAYQRWLPLINYENRQSGLLAAKILMNEGGVIASEAVRHPLLPVHPAVRAGLIEIAQRLDPLVLRWAR